MKRSLLVQTFVILAALAGTVHAADFQIDPVHTSLIYRIRHMQSSYSYGRFNKPAGTFSYDPAAPEKTTFSLTVSPADIDSGDPQRDTHLKSPDFFNARQYPTITFKSTSVQKSADGRLEVAGNLTLHGVTRPLMVPLAYVGTTPGGGATGPTRAGFEGTVEFKRSDFGMNQMLEMVGDEVRMIVSIEGIQK
jgi:polyisoprenoid-binding protein YceI